MLTTDAFLIPLSPTHRQYEALRAHYVEGKTPTEAAAQFGYTLSAYYAWMHELRHQVSSPEQFAAYFFAQKPRGRKPRQDKERVDELIGELRKKYLSVPDIKALPRIFMFINGPKRLRPGVAGEDKGEVVTEATRLTVERFHSREQCWKMAFFAQSDSNLRGCDVDAPTVLKKPGEK